MAENAVNTEQGVILEALNNKVDLNQLNTNNQGLSYVSGLSMPSDKYIDLELGASGTKYTAPANGYVNYGANSGGCFLENKTGNIVSTSNYVQNLGGCNAYVPVNKGDTIFLAYNSTQNYIFRFIYANGSESEE